MRFWRRPSRSSTPASALDTLVDRGLAQIGRGTYGAPHVEYWDERTRLTIGSYCSFASGVRILLGGEHRTDWVTTYPLRIKADLPGAWEDGHPATKGDVAIGHDVWVGTGAMILSGVTIGDGAVIGAGSIVTHDVPTYAVVAGNPARVVRTRFDEATVAALLRIAWWGWPEERVLAEADALCSPDIAAFIRRHDPGH